MAVIFALTAFLFVFSIAFVLPLVSFFLTRRALAEARELRTQLEALEVRVASLSSAERIPPMAAAQPAPRPDTPSPRQVPPVEPPAVPVAPIVPPAPSSSAPRVEAPSAVPPAPEPLRPPTPATPSLEQIIGSRWLLYAGIAAVVLGMSYFVKFAFDNGWVSEPLRVAVGVIAGLALLAAGIRFHMRGLEVFGQALAGGGVLVLYLAIYAALHFYRLISPAPAFGLMALVTAGAAYLADRLRAQPLAALALVGGFATPLLIGGERGAQVVLFTYIAILISGSALIARRHAWPFIGAAAYLATVALVNLWFLSSYRAEYWLRTELFLTLFVSLFAYLLWTILRTGPRTPQAQMAAMMLATAPLAYHVASLFLLNGHPAAWLVYVVLVTAATLVVSQRLRAAWLRVLVLFLVGLPMMVFLEGLREPAWYLAAIVVLIVLYGMHLAAQFEANSDADQSSPIPAFEAAHAQINGLLLAASLYVFLDARYAWSNAWVVAGLAAWNGVLALALRSRMPRLHLQYVALSATLAAVALVLAFDGPAVAVGWAAEGVLLGWLYVRERRRAVAAGAAVLIGLGTLQLVQLLMRPLAAGTSPLMNARALAIVTVIALLAWLAWRLRSEQDSDAVVQGRNALIVIANLLAIALLSSEIHAFFDQRALDAHIEGQSGGVKAAGLAEQVTLTVGWALYAVALTAVGMRRRYAPARYLAFVLFGITILKVMQDISRLDRFYQMLSAMGVGLLLLLASYLYQRTAAAAAQDDA